MNKKFRGASLVQYAIILAILVCTIVPVFFLFGRQIVDILTQYTNAFANMNTVMGENIVSTTSSPPSSPPTNSPEDPPANIVGPLGGTPSVPVKNCTGSTCTIDFGTFVLNGIKDNYPDFVETAGTAAGSSELIALLEQLADDPALPADLSRMIKELANRGHSLASNQLSVEVMLDGVSGSDYSTWARDGYRSIENNTAFADQYNLVMQALSNSGDVDMQNVSAIVDILSSEIIQMNDNLTAKCTLIDSIVSDLRLGNGTTYNLDNEVYGSLHPATSTITDVDSAIICETGDGTDPGGQCN